MFNYIKRIQQKPENVRRNIAFLITIILFSVIIFLWLFFDNKDVNIKKIDGSEVNTPTPFTNVMNTIDGAFFDIKKQIGNVMEYAKDIRGLSSTINTK